MKKSSQGFSTTPYLRKDAVEAVITPAHSLPPRPALPAASTPTIVVCRRRVHNPLFPPANEPVKDTSPRSFDHIRAHLAAQQRLDPVLQSNTPPQPGRTVYKFAPLE